MKNLKPIEKQSTSKRVLMSLKEAIFTKKLLPGERITLNELASQLNVSITPVREALLILEQEQLVKITPHKETIILGIDEKYIHDYYSLRAVLEGFMVHQICVSNIDLEPIEKIYKEMEVIIETKDFAKYKQSNMDFHFAIWTAADNRFIDNILNPLWVNNSISVSSTTESNALQSFQEHKILMEAMRQRDAEKARTAMYEHIIRSMKDILTHFTTE